MRGSADRPCAPWVCSVRLAASNLSAGNGATPIERPPHPSSCSVAPFVPQRWQRAQARSISLELNGKDWRPQPLVKRQARLDALLARFDCPAVLMSKSFDDGAALLRIAEKHKLEGVVSKKRDAPYRPGPCRDWVKVKTAE